MPTRSGRVGKIARGTGATCRSRQAILPTLRIHKPGMNAHDVTHCLLRSAIAGFALALFAFSPSMVAAQVAGRPITIIVPYTPGTGIDILARALGGELRQAPGPAGRRRQQARRQRQYRHQLAARAAPDGQTLLMIAKIFVTNSACSRTCPTIR